MPSLEELAAPGKAAILTMEMQRGVIGDLATIRPLADLVASRGIPERTGGLLEAARRLGMSRATINRKIKRHRLIRPS